MPMIMRDLRDRGLILMLTRRGNSVNPHKLPYLVVFVCRDMGDCINIQLLGF
jgi:hypothetical protein